MAGICGLSVAQKKPKVFRKRRSPRATDFLQPQVESILSLSSSVVSLLTINRGGKLQKINVKLGTAPESL